jgi:hypothetical protein
MSFRLHHAKIATWRGLTDRQQCHPKPGLQQLHCAIEMLPHVRPFNVMASGKNAIACPLEMSLKLPPIEKAILYIYRMSIDNVPLMAFA